MSSIPSRDPSRTIATSLKSRSQNGRRLGFRFVWQFAVAIALLACLGLSKPSSAQGVIFVTDLTQKINGSGGCSLPEAIYAANFDDNIAVASYDANGLPHFVKTNCLPGNGNDRIILPVAGFFIFYEIVDDIESALGPTATPGIRSVITIEGNGSTLQLGQNQNARAFSVAQGGNLTIQNLYIKGFKVKGGDGAGGGGGGLGAGGAIYVEGGHLTVENSTFDGNRAVGGNGGPHSVSISGGGGGLSGNGGDGGVDAIGQTLGGGGGGGSRGNGARGGGGPGAGSGGGGTLTGGTIGGALDVDTAIGGLGGLSCGGAGGNADGKNAQDASCPGGGGGGGGAVSPLSLFVSGGHGGNGNYGGGGGGGGAGGGIGDGGRGGFGGGGGEGDTGGDGGYGGGGGGSSGTTLIGGNSFPGGNPGHFAGQGGAFGFGGGGAALGGAIFSHNGTVVVQNSTFANNFVVNGVTPPAPCFDDSCNLAADGHAEGGAIFAVNGSLTVQNSTINANGTIGRTQIFVDQESQGQTSFTLENSIVYNEAGLPECSYTDGVQANGYGNLVGTNAGCPGVVSSANPLLGPLQLNSPGITPTMAISKLSPALDSADPSTSLTIDQRGFPRPQENGFDIGAFELCIPKGILAFNCVLPPDTNPNQPTMVNLTMQASPTGTGTTIPAPGNYPEALNSVVVVSATPNPGYGFLNWTGGAADPTNPLTTVVIDQGKTITANFAPLGATMAGNIIAKTGPANARVWTLSLLDNGPGVTQSVLIHDFTLTQTFGAACTPILKNAAAFPLSLSNLAAGQTGTTNVTLDFTGLRGFRALHRQIHLFREQRRRLRLRSPQ